LVLNSVTSTPQWIRQPEAAWLPNSVTSTPQWIRQPEAAWMCVWCLCAWCLFKYVLGHSRVSQPLNLRLCLLRHLGLLTSPSASPTCRRRRLNSYRLLRRSTPGPPPIPWANGPDPALVFTSFGKSLEEAGKSLEKIIATTFRLL
jgi:hypothetical protein